MSIPPSLGERRGVADIADAVNFARTHRLEIAIRGGGHTVAGQAVCDGGLLIDLPLGTIVRTLVRDRHEASEGGAPGAESKRERRGAERDFRPCRRLIEGSDGRERA